ncbi:MAG: cyclic nucleotide-binding domain-containing protein [candidate division NC10 bacterium]|nr:cyclic nucleotide-binding domain-containing protein [candidate division NC10 bacterium]
MLTGPPVHRSVRSSRMLMEVIGFLKEVPMFRGLPEEGLKRIVGLSREEGYRSGAVIFREGDPGETFYIIVEGTVRISKFVPGAGEEAMAFLEKSEYFGEMSLIDDHPRSAMAIAHTDCRLLVIDKIGFWDLLSSDRELASQILRDFCRVLSRRLRETSDRLVTIFSIARAF